MGGGGGGTPNKGLITGYAYTRQAGGAGGGRDLLRAIFYQMKPFVSLSAVNSVCDTF
jgi:hypothetical protein